MGSHLRAVLILGFLLSLLLPPPHPARAGPFQNGRLLLHFNDGVVYTPGENPRGGSMGVLCGDLVATTPITDQVTVCFVIATFPHGARPTLWRASFGIDYDPGLLQIVNYQFYGDILDRSLDWPAPGTSAHLRFGGFQGESIELLWLAVRQLTDQPSELRLVPGGYGGYFGGTSDADLIDGFGSMGFGQPGTWNCPSGSTCCLPDQSCDFLTPYWCEEHGGIAYEGTQDCEPCADTGGCCVEWECELTLEAGCAALSGEFLGPGSGCDPRICVPFGACCQPDGSCTVTQQDECPDHAFIVDASCSPSGCAQLGACCYFPDFSDCVLTSEVECEAQGSEFHGIGTVCTPGLCLPGVCCSGDDWNDCRYSTREDCEPSRFNEGAFGPPDKACFYACCCGPSIEVSWGAIKNTFRGPRE